jgi:predicted ATP-dependent protease
MRTIPDLPSALDLDLLERSLSARRLDRIELAEILYHIDKALQEHASELDQSGGLLTGKEEAARPSLARQAQRLREQVESLAESSGELRDQIQEQGQMAIRQKAREFLKALRKQRDLEADVKLESLTDIGGEA